MSQVIVTNDNFQEQRQRSREQERKIDRNAFLNRWKKATDATRPSIGAIAIGFVLLPVIGFWALILLFMSACLTLFVGLLRGLGLIISQLRK